MKGLIALDIDGTITVDHHSLESEVVDFFSSLSFQGWEFVFITGRTFQWGYQVLKYLPFKYHLAVQNGAIILEMPEKRIAAKHYLNRSILPAMEQICHGEPSDFVIYGGMEVDDVCYYRPRYYDARLLEYLEQRCSLIGEKWIPVENFDEVPLESFPSVKCFGEYSSAERLSHRMEQIGLHAPMIRDPVCQTYYVVQATDPLINKGEALKQARQIIGNTGIVIAAGDDLNDLPMLREADVRVVMSTAPDELLELADTIAPPAHAKGIIQGLEEACLRGK